MASSSMSLAIRNLLSALIKAIAKQAPVSADYLFARGRRSVTLDLSQTSTIDPAAVQELLAAQAGALPGHTLHVTPPPG